MSMGRVWFDGADRAVGKAVEGVVIRRYRAADVEAVLRVWARASAVGHPFLGQDFLERERRKIPDVYLPEAETWVWEADGHVVGFLSLLGNEVGGLFVDPGRHRSGIGRALIDRARALRGAIEVEVFERNLVARAFYEALGFELVQRTIHDPTGLEVLQLRLEADVRFQPSHDADG